MDPINREPFVVGLCNSELLREKWISVLFHIQNKHRWTGCKKFKKCQHPRMTKKQIKAKEWISPKSEAYEALQNIVLDAKVLKDLNSQQILSYRSFRSVPFIVQQVGS